MRRLEEVSTCIAPEARARAVRVVATGGGTGLPRVLAGLAGGLDPRSGRALDVTALVTTADDGGSSGELRRRYGVPAPGDVRRCLVALAGGPGGALAALFQHRFEGEGGLAGHTVGNVILTALAQRLGGFGAAVDAAAGMLGARGRVLPGVDGVAELVAVLEDGREVRGERAIAAARGRVAALRLSRPAAAPPEAIAAVLEADLVVLGPGSLFSSVLASVLGDGLAEALRATAATRVLCVNLFSEPGETDGLDAAGHVRAVQRQLGDVVDVALAHRGPLPPPLVDAFAARGARPVAVAREAVQALGPAVVLSDLLSADEAGRHDPRKLARALLGIARVR